MGFHYILNPPRKLTFWGNFTNSADPDQTPHNAAFDKCLQYLLTDIVQKLIENKIYTASSKHYYIVFVQFVKV